MNLELPLCEIHAPHLVHDLTHTERERYQARVFVVIRQADKVARAHVCPTCFEQLQKQMGAHCTEVSQREYNETIPTV